MNPPTAENTTTTIITDAKILDLELKCMPPWSLGFDASERKYIHSAPRHKGCVWAIITKFSFRNKEHQL